MKTLLSVIAILVAILAWVVAVVDYTLAKIAVFPRAHLVPARTFFATFYATRAYLNGYPVDLNSFRLRDYPRRQLF